MKIIYNSNKPNENTKLNEEKKNNNKALTISRLSKDNKFYSFHFIGILLNIILIINLLIIIIKSKFNLVILKKILKEFKNNNKTKKIYLDKNDLNLKHYYRILKKEAELPNLKEFYSKRTFEKRIPLPKEITCKPHVRNEELIGFLSFLTIYYCKKCFNMVFQFIPYKF